MADKNCRGGMSDLWIFGSPHLNSSTFESTTRIHILHLDFIVVTRIKLCLFIYFSIY